MNLHEVSSRNAPAQPGNARTMLESVAPATAVSRSFAHNAFACLTGGHLVGQQGILSGGFHCTELSVDRIAKDKRRELMARVRSKNTKPELVLRRALYAAGLRYRIHRKDLPGRPDVSFAGKRLAIFVNGCFWHGCPHCRKGAVRPQQNAAFWEAKIATNVARDKRVGAELGAMGWHSVTVWECQLKDVSAVVSLIKALVKSAPED